MGKLSVSKTVSALWAVMLVLVAAASAAAQTTVTAAWDRNTDAYTTGYRLYYGTASGNYQWNINAGNNISTPVTLTPGSIYYFSVRGYNAQNQEGPGSTEATIDLRPVAPPTASLTGVMESASTARLTWSTTNAATATINGNAVALNGTTSVPVPVQTVFTLVARAADGRTATAITTVTPPSPTAQISAALQDAEPTASADARTVVVSWATTNAETVDINGVAVAFAGSSSVTITETTTFTITAIGAGGQRVSDSTTVSLNTATAPGSPRNMSASVSGTRATLRWQAPGTGGTPSFYQIFVGSARGWSDLVNGYNVGNVLSVSGDLPRGTYYARSRAGNSAGTSLSSNEVTFRIGRQLRSPSQLRSYWSRNRVTITWIPAAADTSEDVPNNYVLEAGTAPGLSNAAVVSVGNTTSFTAEVSGGVYYVRVRAQNDLGESDPSTEIEIRSPGAPEPPTAFMQSGQGPEVTLRWTAPTGGYEADGYVIEAGSAPGLTDLAVLHVGNVVNFTTLAPPGTYYVRVRAVNASGPSLPSNEIVVRR